MPSWAVTGVQPGGMPAANVGNDGKGGSPSGRTMIASGMCISCHSGPSPVSSGSSGCVMRRTPTQPLFLTRWSAGDSLSMKWYSMPGKNLPWLSMPSFFCAGMLRKAAVMSAGSCPPCVSTSCECQQTTRFLRECACRRNRGSFNCWRTLLRRTTTRKRWQL